MVTNFSLECLGDILRTSTACFCGGSDVPDYQPSLLGGFTEDTGRPCEISPTKVGFDVCMYVIMYEHSLS